MKEMVQKKRYNMINKISNESLKFMLPLVAKNQWPASFYMNDNFIGCFIGDVNRPEFDGTILLAYHYPRTIDWAKFEIDLTNNPRYISNSDYDYGDEKVVIYRFSLEDREEDFEKFIIGDYSQLSPESKLDIEKFWFNYSKSNLPIKIIEAHESLHDHWFNWKKNPTDYCQDGELWKRPDVTEELFDIEKI